MMSDQSEWTRVCSRVFDCARRHFGERETSSENDVDTCVAKAIRWIVDKKDINLSILGRILLRKGLSLSEYEVFIIFINLCISY